MIQCILARRGEAVVRGVRRHLPLCPRWKESLAEGPFFFFESAGKPLMPTTFCFVQDFRNVHALAGSLLSR